MLDFEFYKVLYKNVAFMQIKASTDTSVSVNIYHPAPAWSTTFILFVDIYKVSWSVLYYTHVRFQIWRLEHIHGDNYIRFVYLLRLDFKEVTDWELLCQLRFLWFMNQLLICFSCNPVSSTSFALSSSWKIYLYVRSYLQLYFDRNEIITVR